MSLEQFLKALGRPQSWLSEVAGVDRSVINRALRGRRPLSRLAAIQIEESLRALYARREIDLRPPTREELTSAFSTPRPRKPRTKKKADEQTAEVAA